MKKGFLSTCIALLLLLSFINTANKAFATTFNFEAESNGIITYKDIVIFPEPNGLVQIQIDTGGKELPKDKEGGSLQVMMRLTAGGATLNTYGEIKVQGSSTVKWPKKNWTLSFFKDSDRKESLRLKIGDSVVSDKWIAKAEWVDPTMLRNGLSYRLWEEMIKSRDVFPKYEVDNAWYGKNNMFEGIQTGAQGFPKSYPAQIIMDGEHYGIVMLLLGHEPQNFNIDENKEEHLYMEFDARGGYTDVKTWEKFNSEGLGQWLSSYTHKNADFTEKQKAAIDRLGELINGTQEDFNKDFDRYLDKTNMIDFLLFLEAIFDYDAVAQDIEIVTYDLEKWYMFPWDKDSTFGMDWNERGIIDDSAKKLLINYTAEDPSHKLWYKTYQAFKLEVEERYKELRDKGVFSPEKIYELAGSINKMIPGDLWEAERIRWEEDKRPSLDETSTYQIISWFTSKLETLDIHFNYKKD